MWVLVTEPDIRKAASALNHTCKKALEQGQVWFTKMSGLASNRPQSSPGQGLRSHRVSGSWGSYHSSSAVSALSQVKIQPSAYDHSTPTLEALVHVPGPHSEGPITHTWTVQTVSSTEKRAK